jgi:hypothetical protein
LDKIQDEDSTSDVHHGLDLRSKAGFSYKINMLWEDTGLQLGQNTDGGRGVDSIIHSDDQ